MSKQKKFGLSDDLLRDMKSRSKFDSLPIEIMAEILANLPVESLMRLKSLNKSWYFFMRCLIKDPEFAAKHLHRSEASPTLLLVCNHVRGFFDPQDQSPESPEDFDDELVTSARVIQSVDTGDNDAIHYVTKDLDFPLFLQQGEPSYLYVCHCNGVICLTKDFGTLTLYNPALREFDVFRPKSKLGKKWAAGIGVGCDSTGRTYKVVRLFECNQAEVFVPGTSAWWREINMDIEEQLLDLDCHVYLRGNCFWLMMTCNLRRTVLRFSVGSEAFHSIPLPHEPSSSSSEANDWSLNLYNDSICAASSNSEEIVMWVMDVDDKSGSYFWTKNLRFSCGPDNSFRTFWKSDEVLVDTEDREIMSYNLDTGKLRKCSPDLWTEEVFYLDRYIKSLVSIKGMNQALM